MQPAVQSGVKLSPKERLILDLVCKGLRNSEIASIAGVTERTIKWYLSRLFQRFEVTNRTELAGYLAANGAEVPIDTPPHASRVTDESTVRKYS